MTLNTPADRIAALRAALKAAQLDAWIAPSADPHLSEYIPEHWQVRRWLSGFDGSVPTLIVTADRAELWADSRYWEQAEQQLQGSGIVLQKLGFGKTHIDSLAENLAPNSRVGTAADMLSLAAKRQLEDAFATKNISLHTERDLINDLWQARPPLPQAPVFPHDPAYIGESTSDKLARVRAAMQEHGATHHLISSLDDIAWLTNLRGSDVPYNPVYLAFLLIDADHATLYLDEEKLDPAATAVLAAADITTAPYSAIGAALARLEGRLLLDPAKTAISTLAQLPAAVSLVETINPSTLYKSCKHDSEIAHTRDAMIADGAALCGFFAELEAKLAAGEALSELDIDPLLEKHRSQQPQHISASFGTIAGYNANAALPHYSPSEKNHSRITGDGLLLIDSGGQYQNGTTDITRVIPIGTPSAAQKRDYTLVLKAHIALAQVVFPENTPAPMLDAICRLPMWQAQCDYGHGTGHGVGYFLNVHEGPQVIAYRAPVHPHSAMKAGMITSNEPGLYRPGKWGIRIENLMANRRVERPQESDFGDYLYFETLTLCPIDTRLIERAMLTDAEAQWLNDYHATVRDKLAPHTSGAARAWLEANTQPI